MPLTLRSDRYFIELSHSPSNGPPKLFKAPSLTAEMLCARRAGPSPPICRRADGAQDCSCPRSLREYAFLSGEQMPSQYPQNEILCTNVKFYAMINETQHRAEKPSVRGRQIRSNSAAGFTAARQQGPRKRLSHWNDCVDISIKENRMRELCHTEKRS